MVQSGLEDDAADFSRWMIATFEAANVDVIVINAAGCGSAMREYGHILRDDPEWAARAASFSAKCKDISEILCELPTQSPRHPLPMRIAYHDACHLRHAQAIFEQPRPSACYDPRSAGRRCRRNEPLLWLRRRLPSRNQGRSRCLGESRMPDSIDEWLAATRTGCHANLPYGGDTRRLHPEHISFDAAAAKRLNSFEQSGR